MNHILDSIVIAAITGGIMSIAIAVLNNFFQRSRTRAEISKDAGAAAESISDAALQLIAPLKAQIDAMQARLQFLEKQNTELRLELASIRRENMWLKNVLRQAKIAVPPVPEDFSG